MPITLFGQATILLKPSRDDGDIGNVVVEDPPPVPSRLSPDPSLFREGGIYTINFSFLPSLNREGTGVGPVFRPPLLILLFVVIIKNSVVNKKY